MFRTSSLTWVCQILLGGTKRWLNWGSGYRLSYYYLLLLRLRLSWSIKWLGHDRWLLMTVLWCGCSYLCTLLLYHSLRLKSWNVAILSGHFTEHLYVRVCLCQLSLKAGYFGAKLVYDFDFGVDVLGRFVSYKASFHSIIERRQILFNIVIRRSQTSDHQRVWISAQWLLKQRCQLGVSVGDVTVQCLAFLSPVC